MYSERALGKRKIKRRYPVFMKNNGVDNTEKLPDSVLLIILHLIPTESLRHRVKYVCKQWFKIITNEILSEVVFIIMQQPMLRNYCFATDFVEIYEENNNLNANDRRMRLLCEGRVRSSCNELLLITEPNKHGALYVYNLMSKDGRTLPLSINCGGHSNLKCGLALVYDKFRGLFKIVHIFAGNPLVQCEIFELESESLFRKRSKWRKIDVPSYVGQRKHDWDDPISVTGRYIYWDFFSSECRLSMDIFEEKFYEIPLPRTTNNYSVLEIGGYLGLELPIHIGAANMWILNHVKGEELLKGTYIDFFRSHAEGKEWQKLRGVRMGGRPLCKYPHDTVLLKIKRDCSKAVF